MLCGVTDIQLINLCVPKMLLEQSNLVNQIAVKTY